MKNGHAIRDSNRLIIAARATRASSVALVEEKTLFHKEYKKAGTMHLAYSHLLCAQVKWHMHMHGFEAMQFANVHFHHMVAEKDLRMEI